MKRACDLRHVVLSRLKVLGLEFCGEGSGHRVYKFGFGMQGSEIRVQS